MPVVAVKIPCEVLLPILLPPIPLAVAHEAQWRSGRGPHSAEAAHRPLVGIPVGEIVSRMPQHRDAIANRWREFEPFLAAMNVSGMIACATGSDPFAPPGHKSARRRARGDRKETGVQRAGPQQRHLAVLI